MLHGGFQPELAIYVRLELLEGLSALYSGSDKMAARRSLLSAQAKWQQLAVSDDALAQLLSMGFTASEVWTLNLTFVDQSETSSTFTLRLIRVYVWAEEPPALDLQRLAVNQAVTSCRRAERCASVVGMCRVRRRSCCSSASRQQSAGRPTGSGAWSAKVQHDRLAGLASLCLMPCASSECSP